MLSVFVRVEVLKGVKKKEEKICLFFKRVKARSTWREAPHSILGKKTAWVSEAKRILAALSGETKQVARK